MSAADRYLALRAHLDAPTATVLSEGSLLRLLHRHDGDENPDWPTPGVEKVNAYPEIRELMWRLPHRLRVLAALTAAEMVWPIFLRWQGRLERDVFPRHVLKPEEKKIVTARLRVIESVYEFLDGAPRWDDAVRMEAVRAAKVAHSIGGLAPAHAIRAAAHVYASLDEGMFSAAGHRVAFSSHALAAAAIDEASSAWDESVLDHRRARREELHAVRAAWFRRWWIRCRCRFPFAHPESVDLQ